MQYLKLKNLCRCPGVWTRKNMFLSLVSPLLVVGMGARQIGIGQEYQVKALFLFNFTQFVEWPDSAFSGPHSPFVIGVLGEDPFGDYLDELLAGERVNDHAIVVTRFSTPAEVHDCHILFINVPNREAMKSALSLLDRQNMLTVSDAADFTRQGGIVQFFIQDNKIRLRIGLAPAEDADLTISSKLLRLAEIDRGKK